MFTWEAQESVCRSEVTAMAHHGATRMPTRSYDATGWATVMGMAVAIAATKVGAAIESHSAATTTAIESGYAGGGEPTERSQ